MSDQGWKAVCSLMQEHHNKEVESLKKQIRSLQNDYQLLLLNQPVYAVVWARDCDCFESTFARSWESERDFQLWLEDFANHAEGPFSVERCEKQDLEEFQTITRDRVMEAYEDGNGFSVLI